MPHRYLSTNFENTSDNILSYFDILVNFSGVLSNGQCHYDKERGHLGKLCCVHFLNHRHAVSFLRVFSTGHFEEKCV